MNTKAIAYLEEAETVLATYLRDVMVSEDDAEGTNPTLIFMSIARLISRAVGLLEADD